MTTIEELEAELAEAYAYLEDCESDLRAAENERDRAFNEVGRIEDAIEELREADDTVH